MGGSEDSFQTHNVNLGASEHCLLCSTNSLFQMIHVCGRTSECPDGPALILVTMHYPCPICMRQAFRELRRKATLQRPLRRNQYLNLKNSSNNDKNLKRQGMWRLTSRTTSSWLNLPQRCNGLPTSAIAAFSTTTMTDSTDSQAGDEPGIQYHFIEGAEFIDRYDPGGYHPVIIGDTLGPNSRYSVVHKLGFGGHSTTWLARDRLTSRLVAIKVGIADAQATEESHRELGILHRLSSTKSSARGSSLILKVLDSFTQKGPNGSHECLVTTAGSSSVRESKDSSYWMLFQPSVARTLAAQMIDAVHFLHSRNIVHGDLHLGNVLLRLDPDVLELSNEQLYERYENPQEELVSRHDSGPIPSSVPATIPLPIWMGIRSDHLTVENARCVLIDFGEAWEPSVVDRFHSNTPPRYRPPEGEFAEVDKVPLSFSADIWTLGCSLFELVGQASPCRDQYDDPGSVIADAIPLLGPLPNRWWKNWPRRAKWYNDDGSRTLLFEDERYNPGGARSSWEKRFDFYVQEPRQEKSVPLFEEDEKRAFLDMIKSMMVFEPSQRATIQQVLGSEWVQRWAKGEGKS